MIPLSRPSLSELEDTYVRAALESGWVSGTGPHVERFEAEWAQVCGCRHAVAVTSGTAALHTLLLALGVSSGDEVIVPALTYVAVANAVRHAGGIPVVADVDAGTWCLSPQAARAAVGPRTVGIVAVHAYGHPADMPSLSALADSKGIWLIEDGAEAHLATTSGAVVGGLAAAAVFSFYANKIITTGEGGAVTTNDSELSGRVRALTRQGVTLCDDRYQPSMVGLGLRLGNLNAALGCAQLERRAELVAERRRVWAHYARLVDDWEGVQPQPQGADVEVAPWLYSVQFPEGRPARDDAAYRLHCRGIETRPLFPPLGRSPAAGQAGPCPTAEQLADTGLSLPLYPGLSTGDIVDIVNTMAGQ